MKQIEIFLSDIISVFVIYLIISFIWRSVEVLTYKEITPRIIDDIVAIILSISLLYNLK
jgi:hypothetical protein